MVCLILTSRNNINETFSIPNKYKMSINDKCPSGFSNIYYEIGKEDCDKARDSLPDINTKQIIDTNDKDMPKGCYINIKDKQLYYNENKDAEFKNKEYLKNICIKKECFRPDGTKSYDGDVNECIKDCYLNCKENDENAIEKCQKICLDCEIEGEYWDIDTKLKMCPWFKEIKNLEQSSPPEIRGFPGDGKILIEWKEPHSNKVITHYIITAYEAYNNKSGLIINTLNNKDKCKLCEYEIKGLKNQVYYDIIVQSVNNLGIGEKSNIITLAPNGEKLKNGLNNIFYELDDDLEKSIKPLDIDMSCNNKGFNNNLNYILDRKIPDLESYIRKK